MKTELRQLLDRTEQLCHAVSEVKRFELRRSQDGRVQVALANQGATLSRSELVDQLPGGEEIAVVEFWQEHNGRWDREPHYREELSRLFPANFRACGRLWQLIGGTINSASRGELLACTDKLVLSRIVDGWSGLDGLNRVKALSRLTQPSQAGSPFVLRMLIVDDTVHDGDGILGYSGVETLRRAFSQPLCSVFKMVSHFVKVVLRHWHHRWDVLPEGVSCRAGQLYFKDTPIDGILFRDNLKLFKERYEDKTVAEFTERDLRLHATENHTSFHRAGISRQLLQYVPAELGARLLAASDIPLVASHWAKALTGDVASLKYLLGLTQDANADEHEIRNQLIRHLHAGCADVSIPYLRQRVLPILAGIFRNRIRKGRCPGAWLYAAPSAKLGKYEIVVPSRMLSHEERESVRRGERVELLATRYPITGPSSINAMQVVAVHNGPICYVNAETWRDSFQGDFDGDCITLIRVTPEGWQNSAPWIPPQSSKGELISAPKALEQAALSKRDVAIGETLIADFVQRCWEERGRLNQEELNELGTRVICSAVDRAKHGDVAWGISPDDFRRNYVPELDEGKCSLRLAMAKDAEKDAPAEQELRSRLRMLKHNIFSVDRSGLELQLHLLQGWLKEVILMPVGSHNPLHERVLSLQAGLPAPTSAVFRYVSYARRSWAGAVDLWKRTGDDTAMRQFCDRFQHWLTTVDKGFATSTMLELGKQLLRPMKKGNASLFWSQVPASLLTNIYRSQPTPVLAA